MDRRSVLRAFGTVGAAIGSGCVAGTNAQRPSEDSTQLPSTVTRATFTRVERLDEYRLSYRWQSLGRQWRMELSLEKDRYRSATQRPRSIPRCYREAMAGPVSKRVAETLMRELSAVAIDSPLDRLRVATGFARSLEYATDVAATGDLEYPKFVEETLVEYGGDCEDQATLLAGILAAPPFDLEPVLVFFSGHVGVGVDPAALGAGVAPLLTAGSRDYFYVDATTSVPLGTIPETYQDDGVIAVNDGTWRYIDYDALKAHASATVQRGYLPDPTNYL